MLRITSVFLTLLLWCLINLCSARQYALPYDNVPITAKNWKEIDITWPNPFNPQVPNSAKLLRPFRFIKTHHLAVGQLAMLNMVGIGIPNQGTMVTAIKALPAQLVQQLHTGTQPVIGYFKHYVNDVRTYRFRDKDNHIFSIHATPNHPFWIKNLHIFSPITDITSAMALVGADNQTIHLICHHNQLHCGKPYWKGHIFIVYNIEVYHQHVYRVGSHSILVHNKPGLQNAINKISQLDTDDIYRLRRIGEGQSGVVYHHHETNYVVKIYKRTHPGREGSIWELRHRVANPERSARILNEVNADNNFSSAVTLRDGQQVLIAKRIQGTPVSGQEGFNFVKSRGRNIFDPSDNVLRDVNNKLWLIDADMTSSRDQLTRSDDGFFVHQHRQLEQNRRQINRLGLEIS